MVDGPNDFFRFRRRLIAGKQAKTYQQKPEDSAKKKTGKKTVHVRNRMEKSGSKLEKFRNPAKYILK